MNAFCGTFLWYYCATLCGANFIVVEIKFLDYTQAISKKRRNTVLPTFEEMVLGSNSSNTTGTSIIIIC